MRELAIIGIGMHPWGKFPEKTVHQLNLEVAQMALKDANMEWGGNTGFVCRAGPLGRHSGNVSRVCAGVEPRLIRDTGNQ